MILGAGGVLAAVVGLWGAIWAARSVPGRRWTRWAPEALAFVAGSTAPALLTSNAVLTTGLWRWVKADEASRSDVLEQVLTVAGRPWWGVLFAVVVLGAVVTAAARSRAAGPEPAPRLLWLRQGLGALLAACTIAAVAVSASLRTELAAVRTLDGAVATASTMEMLAGVGVGLAGLTVVLALAIGGLAAFTR